MLKTLMRMILLLLCAASSPCVLSQTMSPAQQAFTSLDMHQFMMWVIDPAADGVWESVGWISDEKGDREIMPKTDTEWETVRNSAATLAEAINLLALEPRARDQDEWVKSVRAVNQVARRAMRAAISRDAQAVFEAGSDLENACESCHIRYVYPPEKAELWPPRLATAPSLFSESTKR